MTIYDQYKNCQEWEIIENAIYELIQNQDIQLTTLPEYVVGYITKQVIEQRRKS